MGISFIFRKPEFPIICDLDGLVIAAKSKAALEKQLSVREYPKESSYSVIDISGEGWVFHPDIMAISPMTAKKRWFKKEVIAIYNNRKNIISKAVYSQKSIAAKRFENIFIEIVELLLKAH